MTETETTEFLKRYRRWQRYRWLRRSWWRQRARDKRDFFECSFCKAHFPKASPEHGVLGLESYICRGCIALCAEAVADADSEWRDRLIATLWKAGKGKIGATPDEL
jgi:hypothetical protein